MVAIIVVLAIKSVLLIRTAQKDEKKIQIVTAII